ncbi:MAG TPA: LamG-like jellyroll fold domain-containing protein, partial [Candidatus Nanoarchaeia archaeon]|nr:LamG-like jellyroll fold domain-containing protein [Candidatus Nanoarchaeia archaeon]
MKNKNIVKLLIFYFLFLFSLNFTFAAVTTFDLTGTDTGNWLGTNGVASMAYDPLNNMTYIGGSTGSFGVYNRTENVTHSLSATDSGNWIGTRALQAMVFDINKSLVYFAGGTATFGVYNRTTNISTDLRATDTDDWILTSGFRGLAYDPVHFALYQGIVSGKFGSYSRETNVSTDLSATDAGDWVGTNAVFATTYVVNGNRTYTGIGAGRFGAFNGTTGAWDDLSATDGGTGIGSANSVLALAYDTSRDLVYLGVTLGNFLVYNRTANQITNLTTTDPSDWISTSGFLALAFDDRRNLIYMGLASGKIGVYNRTTNTTVDLSATDTGDWMGTDSIQTMTADTASNLIYIGLTTGKFGVINISMPTVTAVTVSDNNLDSTETGTDNWALSLTFTEAMNTSRNATIQFSPSASTALTSCFANWSTTTNFSYVCDVANANANISNINVIASSAQENTYSFTMDQYTNTSVFNVNMAAAGDSVFPNLNLIAPVNNANYSGNSVDITYTATDDVAISTCWYNFDAINTTVPACTNASIALVEGVHYLKFYVNDTAGNVNASDNRTFTINTPPFINTLILNSTNLANNNTNQNLTVYVNYSDTSGNGVKLIYDWIVNGTSLAHLNMPFEVGSNSTFARDFSQNKSHGIVSGATYSSSSGFDGKGAYTFDGTDDFIRINGTESLIMIDHLSVCHWVNPNTAPGIYLVKCNSAAEGCNGDWWFTASGASWSANTGGGVGTTAGGAVNLNQWQHVCLTYNTTLLTLYVNGTSAGTDTSPGVLVGTTDKLQIGRYTTTYFNGTFDELTVYNRTLSPSQILNLYQNRSDLISYEETRTGENWTVNITPTDGVNVGTTNSSSNVTILEADTTPPQIRLLSPGNNSNFTSSVALNYTATDDIALGSCWYDLNGTNTTIANCGNTTLTLNHGSYYITVYSNDSSGNGNQSNNHSFNVDTIAPNLSITNPANLSNFSVNSVTINFTVTDTNTGVNTCWYQLDVTNTTIASCNNFTIIPNEGKHSIRIYANDTVGNTNATVNRTFEIDTLAPSFSEFNTTAAGNRSQVYIEANLTANDINLNTLVVYLYNTTHLVTVNSSSTSPFPSNFSSLPNGLYFINATANDTFGNINSSETRTITLDTQAPNLSIQTPATNSNSITTTINLNFTATDNNSISSCYYS